MKRKGRLVALVVAVLLFATAFVGILAGCTKRADKLIILNWAQYIDEDLLKDFEAYYKEETGKKVKVVKYYQEFDTNEDMYTAFVDGRGDYDLICPSDYMIEKLKALGKLETIDKSLIENYKNIDPSVAYDDEVSVPYMWGTLGILYNKKYVTEAALKRTGEKGGFDILWDSAYKGRIAMKDSERDAIAATALALNRVQILSATTLEAKQALIKACVNPSTPAEVTAIENKLKQMVDKNNGQDIIWEIDSGKEEMINGSKYLNLAWSGDAMYAMEQNADLAYFVPEEGSNIWSDNWVIPKSAVNKNAAYWFINFMLKPESAKANMDEIGYTSSVSPEVLKASGIDFGAGFFTNETRYPSEDILKRLAVMYDWVPAVEDLIGPMYKRVQFGG